jgi:hypothetical protein
MDIMSMRARALGEKEKVEFHFPAGGGYEVRVWDPANTRPINASRTVNLKGNITVTAPNLSNLALGTNSDIKVSGTNPWAGGTIEIIPDNLKAFESGWIVIGNGSNKMFCIAKNSDGVNPEIFQRSGAGAWTRTRK